MLVTTKEMLLDAQAGHYAVGAFNVENLEFVMAVIKAAEDKHSPVIMQTTPGTIKYANLDYFAAMVRVAAESASVPVALHLDHGDGFDRCMQEQKEKARNARKNIDGADRYMGKDATVYDEIDPALSDKIKYLSVAHLFAEAISHIYTETAVSPLFT